MATVPPVIAPRSATVPAPALRGLAALLAVLVWWLGVLGVSPTLHAAVHHEHGDDCATPATTEAHQCAVTLFAHGADGFEAAPELITLGAERALGRVAATATHDWAAPEHRLRPACGPPRN